MAILMETSVSPLWPSWRLGYTICAFFVMVAQLCMSNSLNFAILCMTKRSENITRRNSTIKLLNSTCPYHLDEEDRDEEYIANGEFTWTKQQEWILLSSYFYGYMIVQPIAGRLADKFGGKFFLLAGLSGQAVMFTMIPIMARTHYSMAVTLRSVQGFLAGFVVPSIYQLYTVWAHPSERAALMSFAFGGYSAGSLIVFPISSMLCRSGWPNVFYVIGGTSLTLGFICNLLIHNRLDAHPWISDKEFNYLEGGREKQKIVPAIPWKQMFTSYPLIAFIVTHICHSYGLIVLNLVLPRYLKDTMHFNLKENGYYSSALYVGSLVSRIIVMLTFTKIYQKTELSLTIFRRIVYCFGNFTTAFIFLAITFLTCQERMYIVFLIFLVGASFDIGFTGAYWVSCLDMAPAFAGLLTGISNSAATLSGILAPLGISSIVTEGIKEEWNYLFYSMAASYVFSMIIYGSFGSSETQEWGDFITDVTGTDKDKEKPKTRF